MNKFVLTMAALSALLLPAAPALAQKAVEEKQVTGGSFVLDTQSGYIFLHGPARQVGLFLRVPTQEDVDAYVAEWEKEFAKAKDKYATRLEIWQEESKAATSARMKQPAKPVEPLRETFGIGPLETRNAASFGPEFVFSKDKAGGYYSYMIKVKPGTYSYYGPLFLNPQAGYFGVCNCMGSVKFDVKPGLITDLGNFLIAAPQAAAQVTAPTKPLTVPSGFATTTIIQPTPGAQISFGLPDSLKSYPAAQADFRAAGKMDNFFGTTISRMPPIPGILGYERDKVIDLKGTP